MYELIMLSAHCGYFESPAKIGLVRLGAAEAVLIDGGSYKDSARKILRQLEAAGWRLRAIYNTHSHADHTGGNRYLQEQTGCKIYAPAAECAFVRFPELEPALLYGGNPPAELRRKFLMAPPSAALPLTPEVLPEGMEMIDLPGHFFGMVGFRAPENVVYLADCLASEETLEKYKIPFVYNVAEYLRTLELVKTLEASVFVPSHAAPCAEIAPLVEKNIAAVYETAETIASLCAAPTGFDRLLQSVFRKYDLTMTFEQYALVGSTLRSYLTWLKSEGRVRATIEQNMLLWERIEREDENHGSI